MTKVFATTKMYHYAQLYLREATEEEEILQHDWTKWFWSDIKFLLKQKKLINININAQVREGKSTVGITIGNNIIYLMKKLEQTDDEFTIKNIARNQHEASKLFRDPNLYRTVIVIDEVAEMEDTGENVTSEIKLRQEMSDVHAMNYIHKIWISPRGRPDSNSDIFIEVVAPDRETKVTHCRLYFEVFSAGQSYRQLLGYVNFNVASLIRNWTDVEEMFYKANKTKKEIGMLKKLRKEDFYVDYMMRKKEKIQLMRDENVMKSRDLDYAPISMAVIEKTKPLIKIQNIIGRGFNYRNYIKSQVEEEFQIRGMPLTILGKNEATDRAEGVLNLYLLYNQANNKINEFDKLLANGKVSKEYHEQVTSILIEERNKLRTQFTNKEKYYQKMIDLNKKYNAYLL